MSEAVVYLSLLRPS